MTAANFGRTGPFKGGQLCIADLGRAGRADLPDYAPVPRASLGPAVNEQGYYVGRVERNLYWVTDGTYQSAFLTTPDGVVAVRRAADHRPQHPAGRGRDRRRPTA